jgi:hypothetical protein
MNGTRQEPSRTSKKPGVAGGEIRVRHRDGRLETVSPVRAARLFRAGEAELVEPTVDQLRAILDADATRQRRAADILEADGLIVGLESARPLARRVPGFWPLGGRSY